jgi:hypothetical protein
MGKIDLGPDSIRKALGLQLFRIIDFNLVDKQDCRRIFKRNKR